MNLIDTDINDSLLYYNLSNSAGISIDYIISKLAILVVVFYFLNVSVITQFIPMGLEAAKYGLPLLMIISFILCLDNKDNRYYSYTILLMGILFLSVLNSNFLSFSFKKYLSLLIVMVLVGPLILSVRTRLFRKSAWSAFKWSAILISFLSCLWYFARLPNLGRGDFNGILAHSMLLAPYAGMGACFFSIKFLEGKLKSLFLILLCMIPLLLAGSRAAVLSFIISYIFIFISFVNTRHVISRVPVIFTALLIIFILFTLATGSFYNYIQDSDYTQTLLNKGLKNTRVDSWNRGIKDFFTKPLLGVGVGVSENNMSEIINGNALVEPGSSYLAVLAMTGITGSLCMILLIIKLLKGKYNKIQENIEVYAILIFLLVHGQFEGWILSAGSSLCFVFWLSLGRLNDIESDIINA
jgi:hypothetical protein